MYTTIFPFAILMDAQQYGAYFDQWKSRIFCILPITSLKTRNWLHSFLSPRFHLHRNAFYWLIIIAAFLYISELKCVFRNLIVKTSALEFYGSKLTTIISWKYFWTACTFIVTWISCHQARPKLNSPMNTKHVLGGSWVHECVCKSNHKLIEKNWWRHTGSKCLLSTPTTN